MSLAKAPSSLKLVTLPPAFGMRNVSPFCLNRVDLSGGPSSSPQRPES